MNVGTDVGAHSATPAAVRICARVGCDSPVKKRTAKYCSVRCCAIDPQRHERLREQARRAQGRPVLPMTQQLSLGLFGPSAANPEAQLSLACAGREDVPAGMSRLAVV